MHRLLISGAGLCGLVAGLWPLGVNAAGEELELSAKNWREGSVEVLRRMKPEDVLRIQVFRIDDLGEKHPLERPLEADEHEQQIDGLLTLLRRSAPFKMKKGVPRDPAPPDRVLVVQPVRGDPFQFAYSADFGEPFAGLAAPDFKEALFAISGGGRRFATFPLTIIHFEKDEVQRVIHAEAIPPHRGSVSGGTLTVELHLTSEDGLSLYLHLHELQGKTILKDEKPMHFGQAKVFDSEGPGRYIVLLHKPAATI